VLAPFEIGYILLASMETSNLTYLYLLCTCTSKYKFFSAKYILKNGCAFIRAFSLFNYLNTNYHTEWSYLQKFYALCLTNPPSECTLRAFSLQVKQLWHAANHSIPSSSKVKNAWIYISSPLYFFMVCRGSTLPSPM
jgi:hypothetical protein